MKQQLQILDTVALVGVGFRLISLALITIALPIELATEILILQAYMSVATKFFLVGAEAYALRFYGENRLTLFIDWCCLLILVVTVIAGATALIDFPPTLRAVGTQNIILLTCICVTIQLFSAGFKAARAPLLAVTVSNIVGPAALLLAILASIRIPTQPTANELSNFASYWIALLATPLPLVILIYFRMCLKNSGPKTMEPTISSIIEYRLPFWVMSSLPTLSANMDAFVLDAINMHELAFLTRICIRLTEYALIPLANLNNNIVSQTLDITQKERRDKLRESLNRQALGVNSRTVSLYILGSCVIGGLLVYKESQDLLVTSLIYLGILATAIASNLATGPVGLILNQNNYQRTMLALLIGAMSVQGICSYIAVAQQNVVWVLLGTAGYVISWKSIAFIVCTKKLNINPTLAPLSQFRVSRT